MQRIIILIGLFAIAILSMQKLHAQSTEPICFPDVPGIDACIASSFAEYWRSNGGLPIFGYPLGSASSAEAVEGQALTTQWTERNRLEWHAANPPAYRVLLGRIGAERLAQLGRDWATEPPEAGPIPGCLWFAETGRNVCDQGEGVGFRSYWETHGLRQPGLSAYERSLALFGLPLTSAAPEPGPDGTPIMTQWFERARFEWHPDNPEDFRVLLGLLGHEVQRVAPSQPATPPWAALSPIGIEINRNRVGPLAERIAEVGFSWVRYNGIRWDEVEAERGQRDWTTLQRVEQELAAISAQGGTTMLVVRGAPAWAQAVPGKRCGPIRPEYLADFAAFMAELVTRYSQPPYNVIYWELGNEPDAPHNLLNGNEPFGCWGDLDQPFNNGAAYAAMLEAVYPAIKAANPEAQVVLGGLLLDCDPARPQPDGSPCIAGQFLEGVLRAGGGAHFDLLGYHAYTYWSPERRDWNMLVPKWEARGGVLLGKRDFVVETLARYGYQKPLIMNEGGLLCWQADPSCGPRGFFEDQANHAIRLYTRIAASDVIGAVWYTLNGPGWNEGGMLDANQQPRPAFVATRFLAHQLRGAHYHATLSTDSVEGYAFATPERQIMIYWSNDATTATLPLPPGTQTAYNYLGEALPLDGASFTVGFEPIILVGTP
ncbi:cellulase family glycosylhydrolase [Candidatus Viridilinea mediisalina]|uniref:Glycoside hydrolase family 5 domain-containing protein n=1 Tax=Candidatus Viridilinea mediisalina TaxID=2024553 RepID=A0A2A6RHD6_9CHLR|nr:cellulase family glycosylhydrolase [Candidatus Viridilinea mediisalina]PDW02260.1 hypothetical protein CJ255_14955 [Candidatus Viridilinea mediisalina]